MKYSPLRSRRNAVNPAISSNSDHVPSAGSGKIYCFYASDYIRLVLELLKKNPYILLDRIPNYKNNKIPFDGITYSRENF